MGDSKIKSIMLLFFALLIMSQMILMSSHVEASRVINVDRNDIHLGKIEQLQDQPVLGPPANPYTRGCSRFNRCRGGPGGVPLSTNADKNTIHLGKIEQLQDQPVLGPPANPYTRGCSRFKRCRGGPGASV
ncbi:hypothetical protein ACFE04_012608 [Oxalis oulophora]